MDVKLIEVRARQAFIPAMALAIVFALPAQAQSIEQWCRAHNRTPDAAARCVNGEGGAAAVPRAVPAPPAQTPVDPGATPQQERNNYFAARAKLVEVARYSGHAAACNVIRENSPVIHAWALRLGFNQLQWMAWALDDHFRQAIDQATVDGAVRGKEPNGCDYFRQHPEAVLELRQTMQSVVGHW